MEKKRMHQTIGKAITELAARDRDKISAVEAWKRREKEYLDQLIECAETNRRKFPGDFFIMTTLKTEKLLTNLVPTFREYFIALHACPRPNYDQSIYKYDSKTEDLIYIWSIPDRDTCHHLIEHKNEVHESERQLLEFVIKFADGTLYSLMKKLNGEEHDSPLLKEK
jgi:hypothetical protein